MVEEQKDVLRTEVTRWEPALQVPALPPTGLGGCHVIDVRYFLQVSLIYRTMFMFDLAGCRVFTVTLVA